MHDDAAAARKNPLPGDPPRPARHAAAQRRLSLQPVLRPLPRRREPAPHRGDDAATSPTWRSNFWRRRRIATLDITGGAPELNPHFRRLVSAARGHGRAGDGPLQPHRLRRRPARRTRPSSSPREQVEIVASLPCYLEDNVDRQRGKGVFDGSIRGLRAQRAGLRPRRLGPRAQPRLQPARAVAAAAAGGARSRLQAHPRRAVRRRFQPRSTRSPTCRSSASARR